MGEDARAIEGRRHVHQTKRGIERHGGPIMRASIARCERDAAPEWCAKTGKEATQLKPRDIDARRNVLWVRQGKGRKDRQTLLSPKLMELLRADWRAEQPGDWLFPRRTALGPLRLRRSTWRAALRPFRNRFTRTRRGEGAEFSVLRFGVPAI